MKELSSLFKLVKIKLCGLIFIISAMHLVGQEPIDHWETVVFASDDWHYRPGNTEPPVDWIEDGFDDSFWGVGPGGIGYADGDDNTTISATMSVYLRMEFDIIDLTKISAYLLHADYDDAFVAYINGQEVARANIGQVGQIPTFDTPANSFHEAKIYQGGIPEAFELSYNQINSLIRNGANTLAIQVHNENINSSDLSSIFFLSLGVNDSSQNYAPVHQYFEPQLTTSNLPIFIIQTDSSAAVPNNSRIRAHLGIINNGTGQINSITDSFNEYNGRINIGIRGSSSTMFPKKSYNIETQNDDGSNNNISILGMPEENDWVLYGPYSDKSLLRNVLSYHIGKRTSQYSPRTSWCEVMLNDAYQGLYVFTEKPKRDKNRVDIATLTPIDTIGDELTGGYLLKIDRDNPNFYDGWNSIYSSNVFYAFEDPAYDELVPVQKSYIRNYIEAFEDAVNLGEVNAAFEQYIDLETFVDYWIASEIFKHVDGWKLSFYIYKKKESNGGKLHFGPVWDLNLAYGNADFGADWGPQGWSYTLANTSSIRPFWVPKITELPIVSNQIKCRWEELRSGGLATDSLLNFLEQNNLLIAEARERNFDRWPILGTYIWPNDFVGDTYEEEYDYLTNWLEDRLTWMDTNMLGFCSTSSTTFNTPKTQLNIYPNPLVDETLHLSLIAEEFGEFNFYLFDMNNRIVITEQIIVGKDNVINMESLSTGVYFYQLSSEIEVLKAGKILKFVP